MKDFNKEKLDYFSEMKKLAGEKVPIRKGCKNTMCFCTGDCQKIIGWREKTEEEKNPDLRNTLSQCQRQKR